MHNEGELLNRVAGGDEQAFAELVITHKRRLEAFVMSVTRSAGLTEEIVQDTFMQVWLIRETLVSVDNFAGFLFILCRNQTMNALRKQVRALRRQKEWERNNTEEGIVFPEEKDHLLSSLLDQAVRQLPPQQQKVWELSRQKGLKHREIAAELQLSRETVKKHIQLANQSIIRFFQARKEILLLILWLLRTH